MRLSRMFNLLDRTLLHGLISALGQCYVTGIRCATGSAGMTNAVFRRGHANHTQVVSPSEPPAVDVGIALG